MGIALTKFPSLAGTKDNSNNLQLSCCLPGVRMFVAFGVGFLVENLKLA